MLTGYILVTRGPRPSNFVEALEFQHTRVQARAIKKAAKHLEVVRGEPTSIHFLADKTIRVEALSSLPAR